MAQSQTPRFQWAQTGDAAWWTTDPTARWGFAMAGLEPFVAPPGVEAPLLLDAYVDHTFSSELPRPAGSPVVPHVRPWVGFVHHTFDTTFSDTNCTRLFQTPSFLASLPACRGLIALSQTLAQQLRAALIGAGRPSVPVWSLAHPTPLPPAGSTATTFTWPKLLANSERLAVHVGAWMRDPRFLAGLSLPPTNALRLRKAVLGAAAAVAPSPSPSSPLPPLDGGPPYASARGGPTAIGAPLTPEEAAAGDVQLLPPATAAQYDAMLQGNVVFLNLVDASAVNTVLECVARNTPVIVNRLPALEEVLGTRYPGFYSTPQQALDLLTKFIGLAAAPLAMHTYLTRLDKRPLQRAAFVDGVREILVRAAAPL